MADLQSGLKIPVEVLRPSTPYTMPGVLFEGDENANRITLVLMQNGEPADIGTVSVSGEVERADGTRVPCKGEQNGNELSIILNANCYNVPGACNIFVIAKSEGVERTLVEINAHVRGRSNGAIVEVENVIPSIGDILQRIDELEAAGIATVEAIEAKGQEVLESLPDDYTALAGEVSRLSDEIGEGTVKYEYDIDWIIGSYIDHATGETVANSGYNHSDYIELKRPDLPQILLYTSLPKNATGIAFYDSEKTFICGYRHENGITQKLIYSTYDIPDSAAYFRFTCQSGKYREAKVYSWGSIKAARDFAKTAFDTLETLSMVHRATDSETVLLSSYITPGYYGLSHVYMNTIADKPDDAEGSCSLIVYDSMYTSSASTNFVYQVLIDQTLQMWHRVFYIKNDEPTIFKDWTKIALDEDIAPINSIYKGKTIVCFGDSRTWYDGQVYGERTKEELRGETCVGYQQTIKNLLGCNIISEGVSGNTSAQICERIIAYDFANVDAVLLEGGVNDFVKQSSITIGEIAPIGSNFATDTVYGAWQSAVEYILSNYPTVRVYMTIPAIAWTSEGVFPYDIAKIKGEIAELYNLPAVNLYKELGISEVNRDTFYCDDVDLTSWHLHFNDYGNSLVGEKIAKFLVSN